MEKTFKVLRKYTENGVKRVKYSATFWNGSKYVLLTFDESWHEMRRCTSPGVSYYSELVKAFK